LLTSAILTPMAEPVPPDGPNPPPERTAVVQITVVPGPRGSFGEGLARIRRRARRPWMIGLAGAVTLAAAVAGVVSVVGDGSPVAHVAGPGHAAAAALSGPGPDDPIEAIYRAPFRCLRVVIAASDPTYARAELDRAGSCWRDAAWATTILHKAGGAWRPVMLDGSSFCSARSVPAVVRAELGVCPPATSESPRPRLARQPRTTTVNVAGAGRRGGGGPARRGGGAGTGPARGRLGRRGAALAGGAGTAGPARGGWAGAGAAGAARGRLGRSQ
jgi:hypothetical protein